MKEYKITFHKEEVDELIEGLKPFPENIFIEEQSWLNNYLLPLISIDLGILNDKLKGIIVHMINPVEPYEGLIGEGTTEFHNEFCSENWIALELTSDNKYRFLGKEDYFLSSPNHKNTDEDLIASINEIKETYQKVKDKFKTTGKLLPWQGDNPQNFMDYLGGEVGYGNWTDTSPTPSEFILDINKDDLFNDGTSVTLTHKGEEFIYIGEVAGYNYCGSGADAILMFYEPKSRIVLFSYDWS